MIHCKWTDTIIYRDCTVGLASTKGLGPRRTLRKEWCGTLWTMKTISTSMTTRIYMIATRTFNTEEAPVRWTTFQMVIVDRLLRRSTRWAAGTRWTFHALTRMT